ncbi:MAG: replication-relaxation family protein [Planctomycetaceae bacterium]|nr:replication-relaxation family protein [Planctomycetaceae bacterium]
MTNPVQLSPRDRSLLQLLSRTPATTVLLVQASRTFDGGAFADERRLRERLQALGQAGFTRHWSTATIGGGLQNYYKLTPAGFQVLYGTDVPQPPRSYFGEIASSHFAHTLRLAEVIVATLGAAHDHRLTLARFFRENELMFPVGDEQVQPDCFFRLTTGGRAFNLAFEIDQSTETVESLLDTSLRHRLDLYDAYQDQLLRGWITDGRTGERPRFRVVFLTRSVQRAYHLLAVAGAVARVPARRLVQAATQDDYLGATDRLQTPLFVDHHGTWQALINLHPSARSSRPAVRLPPLVPPSSVVW